MKLNSILKVTGAVLLVAITVILVVPDARAEVDSKALKWLNDIKRGYNNINQIITLRVLKNATIGGTLAVTGEVTGTNGMAQAVQSTTTTNDQVVVITDPIQKLIASGQVSGMSNTIMFAGSLEVGVTYRFANASLSTNEVEIPKTGYWISDAVLLGVGDSVSAVALATNQLSGDAQ